ncbi:MAG: LPP20 family lipoprotein [Proteobacteria bacterium]|nr:LPP20 family lipoprotein [Pseudomonadota bacterium]
MKKALYSLIFIALTSLLLAGCGGPEKIAEPVMADEFANAPKWVLDPSMEGGLSAVGSAKLGKAGLQFTRTEALANGRDELARIMSVKVKNLVKNFTQTTGIGDAETVDKVASQVSKQVANQTLNGSKQKDLWISPSKELFVLVVLDPAAVAKAVQENVQTSLRNEQALWQQFQAKKAHDELDSEIEKEFGEFQSGQ